jgi:hypothetical protein
MGFISALWNKNPLSEMYWAQGDPLADDTFYGPVELMQDEVVTVTTPRGAGPGSPHMNHREVHPVVLQKSFTEH